MNQKKQRTLAIFALALALVATSVAYAALSTTLSISGSVTKKGGTWDIHLANVSSVETTGTGKMTTAPKISGTNISFTAELSKPGDSVSFTFDIVNGGTLSAIASTNCYEHSCINMTLNGSSSTISTGDKMTLDNSGVIYSMYVKCDDSSICKNPGEWGQYMYNYNIPGIQLDSTKKASIKIVLTYDPNATSVDATDKKMNVTASFPFEQI